MYLIITISETAIDPLITTTWSLYHNYGLRTDHGSVVTFHSDSGMRFLNDIVALPSRRAFQYSLTLTAIQRTGRVVTHSYFSSVHDWFNLSFEHNKTQSARPGRPGGRKSNTFVRASYSYRGSTLCRIHLTD